MIPQSSQNQETKFPKPGLNPVLAEKLNLLKSRVNEMPYSDSQLEITPPINESTTSELPSSSDTEKLTKIFEQSPKIEAPFPQKNIKKEEPISHVIETPHSIRASTHAGSANPSPEIPNQKKPSLLQNVFSALKNPHSEPYNLEEALNQLRNDK